MDQKPDMIASSLTITDGLRGLEGRTKPLLFEYKGSHGVEGSSYATVNSSTDTLDDRPTSEAR